MLAAGDRAARARKVGAHAAVGIRQLAESVGSHAREVDEVWAYSRYVRDCYLEAEVPRDKVHVVPLGIAPEVFRPGLEPLPLQAGPEIRLLFVGGTIHRKGIDVLLAAFARAFRPGDGVGLVIKEMGAKSFYRGQTAEAKVAALRERGYAVEYIDRILSEAEMAALILLLRCPGATVSRRRVRLADRRSDGLRSARRHHRRGAGT